MDYIKLQARAKINITLDAVRKREDGYHDLRMIMQTVNLCDNIFIKRVAGNDIEMKCGTSWLPCDERNLMYRAAKALKEHCDIKSGIYMELIKNIPIAAGLAGGSSDCAATLIGVNNLFELGLSNDELMAIGKSLGADVPYCIMRGTALAEGIGERLTALPAFPDCFILLAKPPISVSTAAVFGALDISALDTHPDTDKVISLIKSGDLRAVSQNMSNVLESVTIKQYPIIADIKSAMLKHGALGSIMSGSGPTVFGIFTSYDEGLNALKAIRHEYHLKEVYLTTVFNTR
jgi:4-diphosphocytidyl-2-C-methyl-D-erythritol kinase